MISFQVHPADRTRMLPSVKIRLVSTSSWVESGVSATWDANNVPHRQGNQAVRIANGLWIRINSRYGIHAYESREKVSVEWF